MSADDVVDSWLVANDMVEMYRRAGYDQDVINTFAKGELIGKVSSYVVRDGLIWWMIGDGMIADGYIPHVTGSVKITLTPSIYQQQEISDTMDELSDEFEDYNAQVVGTIPAVEGKKANKFTLNVNKILIGASVFILLVTAAVFVFMKVKEKKK
jgi:hypothetical protein